MNEPKILASTLSLKALEYARAELDKGVRETESNCGPDVEKYLVCVGLPGGYPWCAAFVSWCFKQAADELGVEMPFALTGGALALRNELLSNLIDNTAEKPQAGDLIFFARGPSGSGEGHVEIVASAGTDGFSTIAGNVQNRVTRRAYGWSTAQACLGVARI